MTSKELAAKKEIIKTRMNLIVILVFILAAFFVYAKLTLGWFANNTDVGSKSDGVSPSRYTFEAEYLDGDGVWQTLDNSDSLPISVWFNKTVIDIGDTATVHIRIKNLNRDSLDITGFGLSCMSTDADEAPWVKDEISYYLGSQISAVAGSEPETAPSTSNTVVHPIWDGTSGTVDLRENGEAVTIPSGDTHEFVFSLAFVDTGVNQNAYRGFGSEENGSKGTCRRMIWFTWDRTESEAGG